MKKTGMFLSVSFVSLLILLGCPQIPNPTENIISGRVYNSITGLLLEGATIRFGDYQATSDAAGNYSMSVAPSVATVDGVFAASNGIAYRFSVIDGVSVNPTLNPTYDIGLIPQDIGALPRITISGTARDNSDVEIPDGYSVVITIAKKGGGSMQNSDLYDSAGGGYSLDMVTFGADCIVFAHVLDGSGNVVFGYYLPLADIHTSTVVNVRQPDAIAYTTVDISGQIGSAFYGDLIVPDFGVVPRYFSGPLTASPESFEVYNPGGYSFIWNVSEQASDTPDAGDTTTKASYSAVTLHSATVTLPDQTTSTNPSNGVDATTSTYVAGLFSHDGITGANMYVASFVDKSTPIRNGMVLMMGTQIALPTEIASTIIGTGSAWDVQLQAAWLSDPSMELVIDKIGPFGPIGLSNLEMVIIVDSNSTAVDLIP